MVSKLNVGSIYIYTDINGAAQVIRSIATTLDINGYGKISFMVLGYSESIQSFFEGDLSAKRHFDSIPLGTMPLSEAIEVLTKGFDEINMKYDEKDIKIFTLPTGGYPHSIQLLGHNVVSIDQDNIQYF